MVSDYLRTSLGSNPVAFAESFYVRFPKVAIGHWPPMYYALQAAWYVFFPATPNSARCLSAATTWGLALLLFFRLRRAQGWIIALCAGALFLVLPGIQDASWDVMSDLHTGLFVFLAIMAFADFLDAPRGWRSPLLFALWSALAILTKGSAWALGPFALLAPLLARRARCFRSAWYWASGVLILLAAAPFYIWTQRRGVGYAVNYTQLTGGSSRWRHILMILSPMLDVIPWWMVAAAGVGFLYAIWRRYQAADESSAVTAALVSGAWIVSQILFLMILPLTSEGRVYVPSLAPAALLFATTLAWLQKMLQRRPAIAVAAPVALTLAACVSCGAWPVVHVDGYLAAANALPFPPGGTTILVSSNSSGEGAFVSERLTRDRQRAGVILLASHALAASSWSGYHYRLVYQDTAAVRSYLADLPVKYIVLDTTGALQPHRELLREAVQNDPADFRLLNVIPVRGWDSTKSGEILLYENRRAGDRHPSVVRVRLSLDSDARTLEYRWP